MSTTFAEIVEDVKQLSPAEKKELQALLKKYLVEERRREMLENGEASLQELREGRVTFTSDLEELKEQLSRD